MEPRPRLTLILSSLDKTLELTGKILLVAMWGLTIYTFIKLPAIVPIHFNAAGKANGYGNKLLLLILPALATILYFVLTKLNKYPHIFNYMVKITENNVRKQYTVYARSLRFIKVVILFIFSLVLLFIYLTTIGEISGPGYWFLPLIFVLLLVPTVMTLFQSFKKENTV